MRVILLDDSIGRRLSAQDLAARWRDELLSAGLLVDLGSADTEEASLIRRLQGGVSTMASQEAEIERLSHPIPWASGGVPPAVWLAGAAVFLGLFMIRDLFWAIGGTPIILGALAAFGLSQAWKQEKERRRLLAQARADRARLGQELVSALSRLLTHTFVVRLSGAVMVGAPDLAWLRAELREVLALRAPAEVQAAAQRRARLERVIAEADRALTLLRVAGDDDSGDAALLKLLKVDREGLA